MLVDRGLESAGICNNAAAERRREGLLEKKTEDNSAGDGPTSLCSGQRTDKH